MLLSSIDVKRVTKRDHKSRDAMFRLRYYVYQHVLKWSTRNGMDHITQTLSDSLEGRSSSFLATINDQAVGSIRMTVFDDIEAEENVILKYFKEIPKTYFEQKSAILSLYCILPEYNNTMVAQALLQYALSTAVKKKVERLFAVTSEALLPYYQHYRFQACSDWYQHEGNPNHFKVMTVETASLITLPVA